MVDYMLSCMSQGIKGIYEITQCLREVMVHTCPIGNTMNISYSRWNTVDYTWATTMPNHRCDEQTTLVVLHWLVKQSTFQSFATKDTTKCACKHYLQSEYTWAFSTLGVSNKEFYEVTH
jgi:hypothetical protein